MRVLIDQQFHPGHHYQYVAQLLPAVCGLADDVVVAVTPAGRASVEFEAFLKPFSDRVRFEPILPEGNPGFPLHDRLPMHRALRDAVKRLDPDYVLIPSGDAQATAMALFRWTGRGALPKSIPCEVGIHFGAGRDASLKVQLRDVINGWNLGLSGCRKVHLVNHLFFERLRRIPVVGRTFSAVPHPVARPPAVGTLESRRRLGLPEHGRYIGLAGSLDSRKALAEFIAAFRDATS
ncbi:MAG TPA: hypothetical protein VFR18_14960, partial [Terriglobia bacterium]|nr:hypothetical protein [Terriglobia bacterium]